MLVCGMGTSLGNRAISVAWHLNDAGDKRMCSLIHLPTCLSEAFTKASILFYRSVVQYKSQPRTNGLHITGVSS
jgi:hypothetical protein